MKPLSMQASLLKSELYFGRLNNIWGFWDNKKYRKGSAFINFVIVSDATEGATGIFNLFILISFFWWKINKDVTKVAGRSSSRLPFLIKLSWSF